MASILASGEALQRQIAESLRANPQSTFGPSPTVAYSAPTTQAPVDPRVAQSSDDAYWASFGAGLAQKANPQSTFGPSPTVAYPGGTQADWTPAAPTAPTTPNLDAHPGVLAARNAENLGLAELENMLQKAREQMIIRFGDPALASMAGFGLDPQAGTFARQNYLSGNADLARIDKKKQQTRKAIIDRLAGRGILFSGDLGYQEGEANQQYGNEVYDARSQVLSKLNELMESFLSQKRALRGNTANALGGAFQDFISNPDLYAGIYGSR